MKNVRDMRDQLSNLFDAIKSEAIDVKRASEMNNTCGKIINSLKVELDYASLRKEKPNISFLRY